MYTKGYWRALDFRGVTKPFEDGHFQIVGDGQKDNVALVPANWHNAEANANLIASAPLMHKALRDALEASHNPVVEAILMEALGMEGK